MGIHGRELRMLLPLLERMTYQWPELDASAIFSGMQGMYWNFTKPDKGCIIEKQINSFRTEVII